MKGIHTFKRDCTTQVTSCRPWSSQLCPYSSLVKKMKAYLEERRNNANPLHLTNTYPGRPTTLLPAKSQIPKKRKARDAKKRSKNHQTGRRQYKVRRIEVPLFLTKATESTSTLRTTVTTTTTAILPSSSNFTALVPETSAWPTASSIMANPFVPSNPSNISRIPDEPKPQTSSQMLKL